MMSNRSRPHRLQPPPMCSQNSNMSAFINTCSSITIHWRACVMVLLLPAFFSAAERTWAVDALPLCPGDEVSDSYALTVDGVRVPVGSAQFNGGKTFHVATFESDATVEARVTIRSKAGDFVSLRPRRRQQDLRIKNGVATFHIRQGEKLVLETRGAPPLFLFGIPEEKDRPKEDDDGVVYFGPGEHDAGAIRLHSGETLYLAAGARVKGRVYAFEADDVTIRGRGVLDAQGFTDRDKKIHGVLFERCHNVAMEGIQIRTGDWWQVLLLLTDNVNVDHVHTLSFGRNNDGIDTDGVTNLDVRNSFIGCGDDGFGIHAVDAVSFGEPPTRNCHAEHCVIWNEFAGNGLRIGASTETGEISDIGFHDIDVLHCMNNAIMIDHSDWATLRKIVFDDFANDTSKPLANIAITKTHYSNDTGYRNERGRIEGLVFRNCYSAGGTVILRGFDEDHDVRGVRVIDCRIKDRLIHSKDQLSLGKAVNDVRFAGALKLSMAKQPAVTSSQQDELVLDNESPGCWAFAGKALQTISQTDLAGGTAWRLERLGQGHAATYEPRLEGWYEVSVYWGRHEGVATKAPWTVRHRGGYTTRLLDQNHSSGWHHLGVFELMPESWVRLVDPHYAISDGPVIADAVRFRRVNAPPAEVVRD